MPVPGSTHRSHCPCSTGRHVVGGQREQRPRGARGPARTRPRRGGAVADLERASVVRARRRGLRRAGDAVGVGALQPPCCEPQGHDPPGLPGHHRRAAAPHRARVGSPTAASASVEPRPMPTSPGPPSGSSPAGRRRSAAVRWRRTSAGRSARSALVDLADRQGAAPAAATRPPRGGGPRTRRATAGAGRTGRPRRWRPSRSAGGPPGGRSRSAISVGVGRRHRAGRGDAGHEREAHDAAGDQPERAVPAVPGDGDHGHDRDQGDDPEQVRCGRSADEERRRAFDRRRRAEGHERVPIAPADLADGDHAEADGHHGHDGGKGERQPAAEGHAEGDRAGAQHDRGADVERGAPPDRAVDEVAPPRHEERQQTEEQREDGNGSDAGEEVADRAGRRVGRAGVEQLRRRRLSGPASTARWAASTVIPTSGWANHGASWRVSSQVSTESPATPSRTGTAPARRSRGPRRRPGWPRARGPRRARGRARRRRGDGTSPRAA